MNQIEILKALVRQQQNKIGQPVGNFYGGVPGVLPDLSESAPQRWQVLTIPGVRIPGLEEFYAAYSTDPTRASRIVEAIEGTVYVAEPETRVILLRAVVTVPTSQPVPLLIQGIAATTEWALYVNTALQRRGAGLKDSVVHLDAGEQVLELLVCAPAVAVTIPQELLLREYDALTPPVWATVTATYANAQAGTLGNQLRWYGSARVGGYSILRAEVDNVGRIVDVGPVNANNEVAVTIEGDLINRIDVGETVAAGFDEIGIVVRSFLDSTVSTPLSTFTVRLSPVAAPNDNWRGRQLSIGTYREIARVQRGAISAVVSFMDTGVVAGQLYRYALQAYGLIDARILSPLSEPRYVVSGDAQSPGSVTFAAGFPQVTNRVATVRYLTPSDEDYIATAVFRRRDIVTTTTTGSSSGLIAGSFPGAAAEHYFLVTSGPGAGQSGRVLSVNASGLLVDPESLPITLLAGAGIQVFSLERVMTDYGQPGVLDELSFRVLSEIQTYYFCTLDRAGNMQPFSLAATWLFDPATDDTFLGDNQPPTVSIRQLLGPEQALLPVPFNDTLNYAVIEVSASDPQDGTTGVTIEYRGRVRFAGTATGGTPTSVQDTSQAFPVLTNYRIELENGLTAIIGSNTATQVNLNEPIVGQITGVPYEIAWIAGIPATAPRTLDSPTGSRGRLIAVARDERSNTVSIRARDRQGVTSVAVAYQPDYDSLPEVTAFEIRQLATADPRVLQVQVLGVVDDDTKSVQWWVDPAEVGEPTIVAPTLIDNLTSEKSFTFRVSLTDGVRKAIWVRPWSDLFASGLEGIDVVREISRVPRTTVVIENRAASGAISADTARALFQVNPAVQTDSAPFGTGTVTSATRTSLTDATKSWPASRYLLNEESFNWFFVQMVDGPAAGKVRRIISHTATVLTTDDWGAGDPNPTSPALPQPGNAYRILRGATWWRRVLRLANGTETPGAWQPTSGREFVSRTGQPDGSAILLQFYSVVTGVPPEPTQSATIDADETAEIDAISLSELTPGVLTVDLQGVDDDVKEWILFARKGAAPVRVPGADPLTAPLDGEFQRIREQVRQRTSISFAVGSGVWHVVVVPINSYGDSGPRRYGTITISEVATTTPQLFDVTCVPSDGGGVVSHLISWSHNAPLNAPATGFTVTVAGQRSDATFAQNLTTGRAPFLQADPLPAATSSDQTPLQGSYRHVLQGVQRGGTAQYTWNYTVELRNGAGDLLVSRSVSITSNFSGVEPTLATALQATAVTGGVCQLM